MEDRLLKLEWIAVFGAIGILWLSGFINWPLFFLTPLAENCSNYLLPGTRLPPLTLIVFDQIDIGNSIVFLLTCLSSFLLIWKRHSKTMWWFALGTFLFSTGHFLVVSAALLIPLLETIKVMGI